MAAKFTIIGGPDLRARLTSVSNAEYTSSWAIEAANRMRQTKPASRRPASNTFTTKFTQAKAAVYGAYWWIFVDRGTKAHDITPRKPGGSLRFEVQGRTIFSKRVHLKRMARRPFITQAAQGAMDVLSDVTIKAWNFRRSKSHSGFL